VSFRAGFATLIAARRRSRVRAKTTRRAAGPTASVPRVTTDVRLIEDDEWGPWLDQLSLAFFQQAKPGAAEYARSTSEPGRARGAFDGASVVGTLRSFGTELTVPGPVGLSASALTAVSVAPTHRRHGVLRRMITGDLEDSKARGEAVSVLLASEFPIYGRFGYGPATEFATYDVSTTDLHFTAPSEGTFELVDLATLRKLAPVIFERFRTAQPGSIGRDDAWWDRAARQVEVPGLEPRKGFQAVYRSPAGELDGYVLYEGKMDWSHLPAKGTLTIEEMVATTPAAYQALWEFCFNVDLATTTVANCRSSDEALFLLVDDARKIQQTSRTDFLWVRVLDTAAALRGRRYLDDGRLVVEVHDDLSLAAGRFELVVDGGIATCTASNDSPHLSLPVQSLGAAYLGGVALTKLAAAGRAEEHAPGALALADRMFVTPRAPWCTTFF
jgi:predicted acetyltransferase